MSGDSTYLAQAKLNWLRGSAMPSPPSALYVALFSGDPTDAGTGGTEVTTSIRAAGRVAAAFAAPSGKTMANSAVVNFGNSANAIGSSPGLTHFAVYDAATGGNFLGSNALTQGAGAVQAGSQVYFAQGVLTWAE